MKVDSNSPRLTDEFGAHTRTQDKAIHGCKLFDTHDAVINSSVSDFEVDENFSSRKENHSTD